MILALRDAEIIEMSRAARKSAARLMVRKALSLRRQSKSYREHYAAPRKDADVVSTGDRCRTGGIERIGVAGAVGLDRLGKGCAGDRVASDIVLIEKIVEAQTKLGLVEAAAGSDCVIEVGVGLVERVDGGLVVIAAVVLVERADALVEHTKVPAFVLIGDGNGLGVRGRTSDPQPGGRDDVELRVEDVQAGAPPLQLTFIFPV